MSQSTANGEDDLEPLTHGEREHLLLLAVRSIRHGLRSGEALAVDVHTAPPRLRRPQACFVTLHDADDLRGCVGTLEARRALAQQVADSAYAAAFRDSRLSPVDAAEMSHLTVDISVLSALNDLQVVTEDDLLCQLRPGIDGVVVSEGAHHATFLPKVWEAFDLPSDFVEQLRRKAGLPPHYWSPALRWQRYTVESFGAIVGQLVGNL